jgi:hypothetical protein
MTKPATCAARRMMMTTSSASSANDRMSQLLGVLANYSRAGTLRQPVSSQDQSRAILGLRWVARHLRRPSHPPTLRWQ